MLSAVEDAPVKISPSSSCCGVTNTLSVCVTPFALVQLVLSPAVVITAPGLYVHTPKRIWFTGEPSIPTIAPLLEVVVPVTPSATNGVVDPTPTKPAFVTMRSVFVEDPTTNPGPLTWSGFTEKSAHGVVVATPKNPPAEVIVVVALPVPKLRVAP